MKTDTFTRITIHMRNGIIHTIDEIEAVYIEGNGRVLSFNKIGGKRYYFVIECLEKWIVEDRKYEEICK